MLKEKIKGREVTLYSVREFAKILGKDAKTITRWQKRGIILEACFHREIFSNLTKQKEKVALFSEQEVNTLIFLLEKWNLKSSIREVPKGFLDELEYVWGDIRDAIVNGKELPFENDIGVIFRFDNQAQAKEMFHAIFMEMFTGTNIDGWADTFYKKMVQRLR